MSIGARYALRISASIVEAVLGYAVAFISVSVFVALAYGWAAMYISKVRALPPQATVTSITIESNEVSQGPVVIGRERLGQIPGSETAEAVHLQIRKDSEGWYLANVAQFRALSLGYSDGSTFRHNTYRGTSPVALKLGPITYEISPIPEVVGFQVRRDAWTANVVLPALYGAETGMPANWLTYQVSIGGRVGHSVARRSYNVLEMARAMSAAALPIRDGSAPPLIIPQEGFPEDSIIISATSRGEFTISLRNAQIALVCEAADQCFQLGRQAWPVTTENDVSLTQITVGRTQYAVEVSDDALTLVPTDKPNWFLDTDDLPARFEKFASTDWEAGIRRGGLPTIDSLTPMQGLGVGAASILGQGGGLSFLSIFLAFVLAITLQATQRDRLVPLIVILALVFVGIHDLLGSKGVSPLPLATSTCVVAVLSCLRFLRPSERSGNWRALPAFVMIGVAGGALTWIADTQVTPTQELIHASWFARHMVVILLFALAGLLLSLSRIGAPSLIFFAALMVVVGLGAVSLSTLVFGAQVARYDDLYSRHLSALTVIGGLSALLACVLRTNLSNAAVRGLSWLTALLEGETADLKTKKDRHRFASAAASVSAIVAVVAIPFVVASVAFLILGELWLGDRPAFRANSDLFGLTLGTKRTILSAIIFFALIILYQLIRRWPGAGFADKLPEQIKSSYLGLVSIAEVIGRFIGALPLPVVMAIAILAMVTAVVPEAGAFGIQPSEINKTVIAVLFGFVFATFVERASWSYSAGRFSEAFAKLLLILILCCGVLVASILSFDLSPILVIGAMMTLSTLLVLVGTVVNSTKTFPLAALYGLMMFSVFASAIWYFWMVKMIWVPFLCIAVFLIAASAIALKQAFGRRLYRLSVFRRGRYKGARPVLERLSMQRSTVLRSFRRWFFSMGALVLVGGLSTYAINWLASETRDISQLESFETELAKVSPTAVERFLSFRDAQLSQAEDGAPLIRHPDLSFQVRKSREVFAASGCGYLQQVAQAMPFAGAGDPSWAAMPGCVQAEQLFPESGPLHPAIMTVPAIQDDFAATLLVASLGIDAGLILVVAQVILLMALFAISALAILKALPTRRYRAVIVFLGLSTINLGLVLGMQFVLAWGNSLGLLPVFGQPMTFVSFGGSHLFFFALPAIVFTLLTGQVAAALPPGPADRRITFNGANLNRGFAL